MPFRHFNGTSDEIVFPANSSTTAWTGVVYCRPTALQYGAPLSTNAASNYARVLELEEEGDLGYGQYDEFRRPEAGYRVLANEWFIWAVTMSAKGATPRIHIFKGGTWTHVNATGAISEAAGNAESTTRLGNFLTYSSHFKGDIAAAMICKASKTDAQIETLSKPGIKTNWAALSPSWLVTLDQASIGTAVPDLSGNGNGQSGISGTSVTGEEPPISYEEEVAVAQSLAMVV